MLTGRLVFGHSHILRLGVSGILSNALGLITLGCRDRGIVSHNGKLG
jgi:hypothetical protein